MSNVGQIERKAQEKVIKLFKEQLGYEYLGNWEYRADNSNVEAELLTQNLRARGYDDNLINKATLKLRLLLADEEAGKARKGVLQTIRLRIADIEGQS